MAAPTIFISYCREDEAYKDALLERLRPLSKGWGFDVWDDQRIRPGDDWRTEIDRAMERASLAVLLLSTPFLNSAFVNDVEVPRLLARREQGLRVVPIVVRACSWGRVDWLKGIQVLTADGHPIMKFEGHALEEHLTAVAERIADLVHEVVDEAQAPSASGPAQASPRRVRAEEAPAEESRPSRAARPAKARKKTEGGARKPARGTARGSAKRAPAQASDEAEAEAEPALDLDEDLAADLEAQAEMSESLLSRMRVPPAPAPPTPREQRVVFDVPMFQWRSFPFAAEAGESVQVMLAERSGSPLRYVVVDDHNFQLLGQGYPFLFLVGQEGLSSFIGNAQVFVSGTYHLVVSAGAYPGPRLADATIRIYPRIGRTLSGIR